MTWAQNTFALCFLIMVPTMGLVTAACYRQRGRSRFSGFVAGTFIGGMTFVGCCILAKLCFPRYPIEEISEWVANAFTLPLFGACLLLTWFFPAIGPERKHFRRRWSVIIGILYLGCVGLGFRGTLWGFRTALPWSASDIHDYGWSAGIPADHTYYLRARVTRPEFDAYVAKLELKLYKPEQPSQTENPTGSGTFDPNKVLQTPYWGDRGAQPKGRLDPWWDPSPDLSETYYRPYRTGCTFAKYERGYLYLHSFDN